MLFQTYCGVEIISYLFFFVCSYIKFQAVEISEKSLKHINMQPVSKPILKTDCKQLQFLTKMFM